MSAPKLHYIYDPLCGWCYAASPLVAAIKGAGIALNLHGGGLFAEPVRVSPDKAAYMRSADARIAELTGQAFGQAYFDRLPRMTFWSTPPIAAVLAAEQVSEGAGPNMLAAIQRAHHVEGQRVTERESLVALAAGLGLDDRAFDLVFRPEAIGDHLARTDALMRSAALQGYPGFLIERDSRLIRLSHEGFYGRPAAFASAVLHSTGVGA